MIKKVLHIILLMAFAGKLAAQLSPGDLANAHKDLEGMSKCTQCHDIGNRVTNDKCLECHKEIKNLINQRSGYHASSEVQSKECAKCHSDHHGRKFDMVRFDEKKFNHGQAGYDLTGAHQRIDCRDCHKPDLIADAGLKRREGTFLGLSRNCASCHEDYHRKTLDNDCAKCHTTEKFTPASRFNHDKTDFPLAGKHKSVQCIDCHQKEDRGGSVFQKFAGIAFKNCNSCHTDPHKNNLGTNCKECHNEQAFDSWSGLNRFNHARTQFTLKGKHKQVDCAKCHQMNATPVTVFQDRLGVQTDQCSVCHKDVHDGQFGANCAECHHEDNFRKVGNLEKFDHNRTHFALKGKHVTVDCKKCHTTEHLTDPVKHNTCAACHTDYHGGQFADSPKTTECAFCHTVEGFDDTFYSLDDHKRTKLPLEGAHMATPCFACHKKTEKWQFKNIGERCVDCHQDIHQGEIAAKWYPNQACGQCHVSDSWQENRFDHTQTTFALKGVHARQQCRDCHKPEAAHPHGVFSGVAKECTSCHEDEHHRQFEQNGVTDCTRCHGFEVWEIKRFNHDEAAFKLDGKHANVKCEGCHKLKNIDNQLVIQYKFKSFECVVCHQ